MAEDTSQSPSRADLIGGDLSTQLSSERTTMSFERTAMSSDRTLMSAVRTSLSMISFGFTIFQLLRALETKFGAGNLPPHAARNFGMGLLVLGMMVLVLGIYNHIQDTRIRRRRRSEMFRAGLVREDEATKLSNSLLIAFLLLILGFGAILRVGFSIGPL